MRQREGYQKKKKEIKIGCKENEEQHEITLDVINAIIILDWSDIRNVFGTECSNSDLI